MYLSQGAGAVFFNKGENCIAAGRLFVERCIHDDFVTRMVRGSIIVNWGITVLCACTDYRIIYTGLKANIVVAVASIVSLSSAKFLFLVSTALG